MKFVTLRGRVRERGRCPASTIPGADLDHASRLEADLIDEAGALADWLRLGASVDPSIVRLVLVDIDGVLTAGEGAIAEPALLDRLASWSDAAALDPTIPALSLCSGRPSPYVELWAQLMHAFLPCLFEHGAGMVEPRAFRFTFNPSLGPSPWRAVAALREVLDGLVLSGRAFVQPGKEATLTLYPVGATTVDELAAAAEDAVVQAGSQFTVTLTNRNVELRPAGIDKGAGARWLAKDLGVPVESFAGVGDADDDLTFLRIVGYPTAPANASPSVRSNARYVSSRPFGEGLLEILEHILDLNRRAPSP